MSLVRPEDATDDELLVDAAAAPLVASGGHGAEFVTEWCGLLLEEYGATVRADEAVGVDGEQELA